MLGVGRCASDAAGITVCWVSSDHRPPRYTPANPLEACVFYQPRWVWTTDPAWTFVSSALDRIGFRETRSFEFGNWRVQKQETRAFELASAPSHGDVRVPWAQPGAAARQPEAPTSSSKVGDNSFATRRPVSSFEFRDVQYGLMPAKRVDPPSYIAVSHSRPTIYRPIYHSKPPSVAIMWTLGARGSEA